MKQKTSVGNLCTNCIQNTREAAPILRDSAYRKMKRRGIYSSCGKGRTDELVGGKKQKMYPLLLSRKIRARLSLLLLCFLFLNLQDKVYEQLMKRDPGNWTTMHNKIFRCYVYTWYYCLYTLLRFNKCLRLISEIYIHLTVNLGPVNIFSEK